MGTADVGAMSNCTLICPRADFRTVVDLLEENAGVSPRVEGPPDRWRRVELVFPSSRLRFTSLTEEGDPEKFDRVGLGLANFARIVEDGPPATRQFIIDAAMHAPLLIGVVGEPEFSDEDGHLDLIHLTAVWLHALIYTGSALLNPTGHLLLNAVGASEQDVAPDVAHAFQSLPSWLSRNEPSS
jgi:hypothetical protein